MKLLAEVITSKTNALRVILVSLVLKIIKTLSLQVSSTEKTEGSGP